MGPRPEQWFPLFILLKSGINIIPGNLFSKKRVMDDRFFAVNGDWFGVGMAMHVLSMQKPGSAALRFV
jgi:hypothetical protein